MDFFPLQIRFSIFLCIFLLSDFMILFFRTEKRLYNSSLSLFRSISFYGTSFLHTPGLSSVFRNVFLFFDGFNHLLQKKICILGWIVFFWLGFWIRIDFLFPTLLLITLFSGKCGKIESYSLEKLFLYL